ncbi:hypothetical protein [Thermophilibacter provencensis]|uniref:ST7 protein n=1 Tax=Thermophilibacter provencensis TaxID=1852386 RepID=A0A921GET1_9ACTN|nr:hypothetical protein [Thermophilibacter provencensis]HJF44524.1 hypothetical protein [Thermophilibacter provencensis]
MNAWDELVERCAQRRLKKLGPLSDEAYAELVLAVRENPESFIEHTPERAMLVIARALDAYQASCRNDDLLDDAAFEEERSRRLAKAHAEFTLAREIDESSLDACLLELLTEDRDPDLLFRGLIELERDFSSDELPPGDAWDDVFYRPHLRLRAALARTCLDTARYGIAERAATSVMDASPSDPLGARHTCALALARLEDEKGFDALDARFSRQGDPWSHLARVILLYKLDRMSAARRALRGFDQLCPGGAYALLRPTYVEPYLPDRPDVTPGGFEESVFAVREAEPIIADVPDFINWCQGHDWLVASARRFAEKNDLDW